MIDLNLTLLVVIINVNSLKFQLKGRDCQIELRSEDQLDIVRILFKYKDTYKSKYKRMGKVYPC